MALKELSISQSAAQLIADINSNIEEVGGSVSVSADGSATALVGVLNGVFDGVTGAKGLSVGSNADDFVEDVNHNFGLMEGGNTREYENLIILSPPEETFTEWVPVYQGEHIYQLIKNEDNLMYPPGWFQINFALNTESQEGLKTITFNASPLIWTADSDGYIRFNNRAAKDKLDIDRIITRSRSRCYINPKYRWVVFGDSLSSLTYSMALGTNSNVNAGYPWKIGEDNHDIAVNNRAVPGQTSSNVLNYVQNMNFAPYDVVSILIGSNDFGYSGITLVNYAARYETIIDTIRAAKPSIKLFICTLPNRSDMTENSQPHPGGATTEHPESHDTLLDYCQAIREVGADKGVPVLDLNALLEGTELDFQHPDPAQRELNINNWSNQIGDPKHGDGLHPTQEAHELFLAPLYKAKLMKVLNDYTLFPDILELENFDEI